LTNTDIHGTSYVKTKSKNSAVVAYRNQDGEIDIGIVASFSLKEGKKECYAILQRLPATDPHEWATSEKRREKKYNAIQSCECQRNNLSMSIGDI